MCAQKNISTSAPNLKIISFFHKNPSTIDTARGLATWLNHDYQQVQAAVEYLVKQKVLIAHRTGGTSAYGYTQDKRVIKRLQKQLKGLKKH